MRFLARFRLVARMVGDATEKVIQWGRQRTAAEGLDNRIAFIQAGASDTGLEDASARAAPALAAPPPPLAGRQLLELKSSISGIPADLEQYEPVLAVFSAGEPPEMALRVRVLMTGVPVVHGAEGVVDPIEGHGGLIVWMENCTGLKPILEDVDTTAPDPLDALAEKFFHLPCSVMTRNDRRLEMLEALMEAYQPECVTELIRPACLTCDVE
ncbi:MAG TPA: 2-hydroxyacyl-CoA dehydratase, partial [Planctomycetaceae bacterium]|nr:2-hydroxyacyl-CoA dehydratase [Planctomycetaceae bacterium]